MPKADLFFTPPFMNAAGSLGFAPDRRRRSDWSRFGAFVTNPISFGRRSPAQGTRFVAYPGGFLLHTGYPNPGFSAALQRYAQSWERSPLPVIVHLLAQSPGEAASMLRRLEGREGVMGVELGLPPGVTGDAARLLVEASQGELVLIVRLPMEQALELAPVVFAAGAAAVSLGAPRGALPDATGRVIEGRLYGPAVFPLALQVVRQLARLDVPVIASGGLYSERKANLFLDAGAAAVQWDARLWLED